LCFASQRQLAKTLYAWVKIIVLLIKGNISNCVYTA
jgi:hypothetical protein